MAELMTAIECFTNELELFLFPSHYPQPSEYFIDSECIIAPLSHSVEVKCGADTFKVVAGSALFLPARQTHEYVEKKLPARFFAQKVNQKKSASAIASASQKPQLFKIDREILDLCEAVFKAQSLEQNQHLKLIASRINSLFGTRFS